MEVAGLVFGGVGLLSLLTAIESTLNGYERFVVSAREAPSQSNKFAINVRIEQHKFQLYWEYMGLSAHDCPLLGEQSARTQKLIVDVVYEIHGLISNARKLSERYGFEESTPAQGTALRDLNRGPTTIAPSVLEQVQRAATDGFLVRTTPLPKLSRRQSFVWKWKDEKKGMELLSELREFNNQLWTSLAPHHEILLRQGEPTWILPGLNDVWALQRLAGEQESTHPGSPLAVCSSLRTTRLQSADNSDIPFYTNAQPGLRVDRTATGIGKSRYIGKLNGMDVIVEYKRVDANMPDEKRELCKERLLSLMKLFARNNHPMLRVLQGVAVFGDGAQRSEFGLVFECPRPVSGPGASIVTLEQLLSNRENGKIEALGRRFLLAQALAKSLMFLHASGWYHKGLNPEGIIFQKNGDGTIEIEKPRIMGFDFSRPSQESELSLDDRDRTSLDLYTHPDRQTANPPRFRAIHDYYSLGMCLIAIGWWRPIAALEKKFDKSTRPEGSDRMPFRWRAFVEEESPSLLKSLCGELYAEAVLACVTGDLHAGAWSRGDGQESDCQRAFFAQVVKKLQTCRA